MPTDDNTGSGKTILEIDAKEVHNKIQTTVNKPTFNYCNFNGQPGASNNDQAQTSLPQESAGSSSSVIHVLQEKLQELYKNYKLPKVAWLTEGHLLPLEKYYVELQLSNYNQPVKLEEMFDDVNSRKPSRILIEGQPGYGKTTLATKLAFDWAMGMDYMNFKLVFLLPLRHLRGLTIENAITKMGGRCGFSEKEILQIVNDNEQDTLFIFDGLDELSVSDRQHITKALCKQLYSDVTVVAFCRSNSFKLTDDERTELFGVSHANYEFFDKQITILGIPSMYGKMKFLNNYMPKQTVDVIITNLYLELKLFDSPLFLMLLPVIIQGGEKVIDFTCKTEFYKQLFNCIIKHSCRNRDYNLDQSFDLFGPNASARHFQDLVRQFGELCFQKIIDSNLQFEDVDLSKKIYNIGFLSKHTEKNLFQSKNYYETFHLSILEFAAAFALWTNYKFVKSGSVPKQLKLAAEHFIATLDSSLILPFLVGLMDNDLDILLLKILNEFPRYSNFFTARYCPGVLLSECSSINIFKSKILKKCLLSDLKAFKRKIGNNSILMCGINCRDVKKVCINTYTQLEMFSSYEITNLSLLLRFKPYMKIEVSNMSCKHSEFIIFNDSPTHYEIKRSLDYVMSLSETTECCVTNIRKLSKELLNAIIETDRYNAIKLLYLEVDLSEELTKKMDEFINIHEIQFLSITSLCKVNIDTICAKSAYLTSIALKNVDIDLYVLTNGGTKKYNHLILTDCTVTCKHSLSEKKCCEYLKIRDLKHGSIEAISELSPTELDICDFDVIKLLEERPTWVSFAAVKCLAIKVTNNDIADSFSPWENLVTLYVNLKEECDEKPIIDCIQKNQISKLIIQESVFYLPTFLKSVYNVVTLKSITLNLSDEMQTIADSIKRLECHKMDEVNLITESIADANQIIQILPMFSVAYCIRSYGSDVNDPEKFKIKYKYLNECSDNYFNFQWIVITVVRKSNNCLIL